MNYANIFNYAIDNAFEAIENFDAAELIDRLIEEEGLEYDLASKLVASYRRYLSNLQALQNELELEQDDAIEAAEKEAAAPKPGDAPVYTADELIEMRALARGYAPAEAHNVAVLANKYKAEGKTDKLMALLERLCS